MRRALITILFAILFSGCGPDGAGSVMGPVPKSHYIGWEYLGPVYPVDDIGGWQSPTFYNGGN